MRLNNIFIISVLALVLLYSSVEVVNSDETGIPGGPQEPSSEDESDDQIPMDDQVPHGTNDPNSDGEGDDSDGDGIPDSEDDTPYGSHDSVFDPTEGYENYADFFNYVGDEFDIEFPGTGWLEDFYLKIINNEVGAWLLGGREAAINSLCIHVLKSNGMGDYVNAATGPGGGSFNINAEYIDISNPMTDEVEGEGYLYRIGWFIEIPGGDDDKKWKFKVYLKGDDDEVSLFKFDDDEEYFLIKFGHDIIDYRGDNMIIDTSSTRYDEACIKFRTNEGAENPRNYLNGLDDSLEWCTSISRNSDYDTDIASSGGSWDWPWQGGSGGGGSGGGGSGGDNERDSPGGVNDI